MKPGQWTCMIATILEDNVMHIVAKTVADTQELACAAAIPDAIRVARFKALEEAAKIAETIDSGPTYWADGRPNAGVVIGGQHIASAIRQHAKGEGK